MMYATVNRGPYIGEEDLGLIPITLVGLPVSTFLSLVVDDVRYTYIGGGRWNIVAFFFLVFPFPIHCQRGFEFGRQKYRYRTHNEYGYGMSLNMKGFGRPQFPSEVLSFARSQVFWDVDHERYQQQEG